jgi:hypothetical protein
MDPRLAQFVRLLIQPRIAYLDGETGPEPVELAQAGAA